MDCSSEKYEYLLSIFIKDVYLYIRFDIKRLLVVL